MALLRLARLEAESQKKKKKNFVLEFMTALYIS